MFLLCRRRCGSRSRLWRLGIGIKVFDLGLLAQCSGQFSNLLAQQDITDLGFDSFKILQLLLAAVFDS